MNNHSSKKRMRHRWLGNLFLVFFLSLMVMPTGSTMTAFAVEQAIEPEDVPKLGGEDIYGKPDLRKKKKTLNHKPTLKVSWTPSEPSEGNIIGWNKKGQPIRIRVIAKGDDEDGDDLRYKFEAYGGASQGPSEVAVFSLDPKFSKETHYTWVTVTVFDDWGPGQSITVAIPYFSADANWTTKQKYRKFIRDTNEMFRQTAGQGQLRDPSTLVAPSLRIGGSRHVPDEGSTSTSPDMTRDPASQRKTSQSVVDGPNPWRNTRVQKCVRDYLNQVAFPVENKLEPGKYTHIDEWGRLLGRHLTARGRVDGNWENSSHFVWSQYNNRFAANRYGKSLRDYVIDCLEGRAIAAPLPGVPAPTAPAPITKAEKQGVQQELQTYLKRWGKKWCAGGWSGCGIVPLNEFNGLLASLKAAKTPAQLDWVRNMARTKERCVMNYIGDRYTKQLRDCLTDTLRNNPWPKATKPEVAARRDAHPPAPPSTGPSTPPAQQPGSTDRTQPGSPAAIPPGPVTTPVPPGFPPGAVRPTPPGAGSRQLGGTQIGLLRRCFETPGVLPMPANRPGYTYRSFSKLFSGCGACQEACRKDGKQCLAWSCFHPAHFGLGGVNPRPITCHLKSELPLPSPSPCDPPPRAPTSGNGVFDDRCYHSSQSPMTLPPRPERKGGVASTISIADPNFGAAVGNELRAERGLLNMVRDYFDKPGMKDPFSIQRECGGPIPDPRPTRDRVRPTRPLPFRAALPSGRTWIVAPLKNGAYGGGRLVPTMGPKHGGKPGGGGVRNTAEGVEFISTETDGRSNALINWSINKRDRDRFRRTGTIAFNFYAKRNSHKGGTLFGDNYGFKGFRHGQGTISATASRLKNGPGVQDDEVQIALTVWHNNKWYSIKPRMRLNYDTWYRIGFAWGGKNGDYELWRNGRIVSRYNLPGGTSLPWGMSSPPSGTNFGMGDNHERGHDAYGSTSGVIFSELRIWKQYRSDGDSAVMR